jgi:hypothetical protein
LDEEGIQGLDPFPSSACDNYRIRHWRLYQGEHYRGYQASPKRYCYGLKLQLRVTPQGDPVAFFLTPGATRDLTGLHDCDFDLPPDALVVADNAYNDYELEAVLDPAASPLRPWPTQNSKRTLPPDWVYLQAHDRHASETTGSLIQRRLPNSIHATSAVAFELKLGLFVVATSITFLPLF